MQRLKNPQAVLDKINAGYRRLDQFSTTFNYRDNWNIAEQLMLIPNSFAHLPASNNQNPNKYDIYDNLVYPRERAMIASLVEATTGDGNTGMSSWGELT